MQHWPLNRDTDFEVWPHFDPGAFIESNPTLVETGDGTLFTIFRRDVFPPRPGHGAVWAVRVDASLRPLGRPQPLLAQAEDPRAIWLAGRIVVFYVAMEHGPEGRPVGCSMAMAQFKVDGDALVPGDRHLLPKYPLGERVGADLNSGWEKNWVPFPLSEREVGLIYAHAPWDVLVLDIPPDGAPLRFVQAYRAEGLHWDWGPVRGGTPPVRWDDGHLVTFFHASLVAASRKVYVAGACVFQDKPPYAPVRVTRDPLLVAPYRSTVLRHGWPFSISAVFPLGARAAEDGFQILSGLDDGAIGRHQVARAELEARLVDVRELAPVALQALTQGGEPVSLHAPLHLAAPGEPPVELPVLNFARFLAGRGRRLVDVGAGSGAFSVALARGYEAVDAFVATPADAAAFARNAALNGLAHARCHARLPAAAGAARLDEAGWNDVDLVRIGPGADPVATLRGATGTLARGTPALMLTRPAEPAQEAELASLLETLDYETAPAFPLNPGLLLALPVAARARYAPFF